MATATIIRWKPANVPGRNITTGIPNRPGGFAWIEERFGRYLLVIEDGALSRKVQLFDRRIEACAAALTWANTL